jgi:hypothetical protein
MERIEGEYETVRAERRTLLQRVERCEKGKP